MKVSEVVYRKVVFNETKSKKNSISTRKGLKIIFKLKILLFL